MSSSSATMPAEHRVAAAESSLSTGRSSGSSRDSAAEPSNMNSAYLAMLRNRRQQLYQKKLAQEQQQQQQQHSSQQQFDYYEDIPVVATAKSSRPMERRQGLDDVTGSSSGLNSYDDDYFAATDDIGGEEATDDLETLKLKLRQRRKQRLRLQRQRLRQQQLLEQEQLGLGLDYPEYGAGLAGNERMDYYDLLGGQQNQRYGGGGGNVEVIKTSKCSNSINTILTFLIAGGVALSAFFVYQQVVMNKRRRSFGVSKKASKDEDYEDDFSWGNMIIIGRFILSERERFKTGI